MNELPESFSLLNPAKNVEEWLANFEILHRYWEETNLGDRLYETRNQENRRFVDELIHETNSRFATLISQKSYSDRTGNIDYRSLVRNIMTVFVNICAADLYLKQEN